VEATAVTLNGVDLPSFATRAELAGTAGWSVDAATASVWVSVPASAMESVVVIEEGG